MIHPDKNGHPLSTAVFQKVSQAYQEVAPVLKEREAKFVKARQVKAMKVKA